MKTAHPLWAEVFLFRIDLSPNGKKSPVTTPDQDGTVEDEHPILCASCSATITHNKQITTVNGSHEHAFFNPAGIAFEIRCFRNAPGVITVGVPSAEFTWFSGYRWQIGNCKTCSTHLGWYFTGTGSAFFGLIKPKLQ